VRIHRSCLVGQKDRGWYQIAGQLDYDRSGIERLLSNTRIFVDARRYAKEVGLASEPLWRDRIAGSRAVVDRRWLIYRVAWLLSRGIIPNRNPH